MKIPFFFDYNAVNYSEVSKTFQLNMDVLLTLFYILFIVCVVYPPMEFVCAGFTITQIFDSYLGSENLNFIGFHMKRMTIMALIHSLLPFGYIVTLMCGGVTSEWLPVFIIITLMIPSLMCYKLTTWWENQKIKHPMVKALLPYVTEGSDWRVIATNVNEEYRRHVYCVIDKVTIPLQSTNKFVATETWLIKISQYTLNLIKQQDCSLVATGTDQYELTPSGNDQVQYINVEVIPSRQDIPGFSFRISTTAMRELQPRLHMPVRFPEYISLLPTLVDRFLTVFKQYVNHNPIYYIDEEPELCIGCLHSTADVKLNRRCEPPPEPVQDGFPQCQPCNCKVLWCCTCIGKWWSTRAEGPPTQWLSGRCTCPVCRATFCMLDVCPVALHPS